MSDKPSPDLQTHLAVLEQKGLLVRIDEPIDKDSELHPLVRCQFVGGVSESERKAFLFTNVVDAKGKRYDMPVVVGALAASPHIYSLGMARPVAEISDAWVEAIANPVKPVSVKTAPCQEVVVSGDDLTRPGGGLARLPVPVSTPGFDAAPTLTSTLAITVDPESGVRNMSTNRAALKATDRLGVRMSSRIGGAGGYLHWLKYQKMGKPMPCAIVVGAAPVVAYTGPQKLPVDFDEMTVAGALMGAPIRTVKAKTVDIEVPADCEIVIEGLIDTEQLEPEGPFGESTGYVALEDYNLSMRVTAITHRRNAVFSSIISQVTPSESSVMRKVAFEPIFLTHLQKHLAIRGIRKVVMHEPLSNIRPIIFLQFAKGTPKTEIWRGLQGASTRLADSGKVVIAVSEDVDPNNADAVFWSMAYRCNPVEDVHIVPYKSTGHGPISDRAPGVRSSMSSMLVDATLKEVMPPVALPAKEFMERAAAIWQRLGNRYGLPRLNLRPPWHGYQLGDWSDLWEEFARKCAAGEWEANGANTYGRRRSGLTPETPVRNVEMKE
ncbi:MAG TPA: UbiD family decarboxylase [Xanthobacteraceae bacterium]|nr:UbiD family decarboxylase [Xanthobacteraceae bacterium]